MLHFGAPPTPSEIVAPASANALKDPIHVAVINGSAGAIAKGRAPFDVIGTRETADLVWDVGAHDAVSRGDLLSHNIDGSMLGAVVDRTWAIRAIKHQSEARVLPVSLVEGGKEYTPGDHPKIVVDDVRGAYLAVFNIAATGEVQLLFPTAALDGRVSDDEWTYAPRVTTPFGADQVFAVATAKPAPMLIEWLQQHNNAPDAALVVAELKRLLDADPSARIGAVGLHTAQAHN